MVRLENRNAAYSPRHLLRVSSSHYRNIYWEPVPELRRWFRDHAIVWRLYSARYLPFAVENIDVLSPQAYHLTRPMFDFNNKKDFENFLKAWS